MNKRAVEVIEGSGSEAIVVETIMEPAFETDAELTPVRDELMRREPLFHRPEFGTSRADFEQMTDPSFWEVGASGRRYSRQFVLDALEAEYKNPVYKVWEIGDFHCLRIAADNYLVTYTLFQGPRVTRRATIWRKSSGRWTILYHQGTIVE